MRFRISQLLLATLLAMLVFGGQASFAQNGYSQNDEIAWRAQHAADLQKPDGWLSLIGLEWLTPGLTTIGSAPDNKVRLPQPAPPHLAALRLEKDSVELMAPLDGFPEGLKVDGEPASPRRLRVDEDHDKLNSRLSYDSLNFYVIRRSDRYALRIKDAHSPFLTGFHDLKWYAPDPAYRVIAKWTPYTPVKTVSLLTLVGTSYSQPVPGFAEFTLHGDTYRLEPVLEEPDSSRLFFILKDSTSAKSTYPACRFLYTPLPDRGLEHSGEVILDFNHLENPPCAYTPYATCPLPPAGNRLPVALPAGEQRYHK